MDVYKWYSASRWLFLHHVPVLPGVIKAAIRVFWGGLFHTRLRLEKEQFLDTKPLVWLSTSDV